MPDAVDEGAPGAGCKLGQQYITGLAVGARSADLDELVIMQGAGGFLGDRVGETLATDLDDGFEGVCTAAQKAALVLG